METVKPLTLLRASNVRLRNAILAVRVLGWTAQNVAELKAARLERRTVRALVAESLNR